MSTMRCPILRSLITARTTTNRFGRSNYAGLGPGAHGFLPNLNRTVQYSDWEKWTTEGLEAEEINSLYQQAVDFVITRLRHCDGFQIQD